MIPSINLLPWRDAARISAVKALVRNSLLWALGTLALLAAVHLKQEEALERAQERLLALGALHHGLDEQETALAALLEALRDTDEKLQSLAALDHERLSLLRSLTLLAEARPAGLHLLAIDQTQSGISLEGSAIDRTLISTYAEQLRARSRRLNPALQAVRSTLVEPSGPGEHLFQLTLDRSTPFIEEAGE